MWIYGLHLYLCILKNLIFLTSEALKIFWGPQKRPNFWILDLCVCLKKVSLGATDFCPVSRVGVLGTNLWYLLVLCFYDLILMFFLGILHQTKLWRWPSVGSYGSHGAFRTRRSHKGYIRFSLSGSIQVCHLFVYI